MWNTVLVTVWRTFTFRVCPFCHQNYWTPNFITTIDLSQGFFQMELDPQSSKYTAFNTCFGTFKFQRCPWVWVLQCWRRTSFLLGDNLYGLWYLGFASGFSIILCRTRSVNPKPGLSLVTKISLFWYKKSSSSVWSVLERSDSANLKFSKQNF
jgi:hypothetical protein